VTPGLDELGKIVLQAKSAELRALFMDGHVEFSKFPGKFPASTYMAINSEGGGTMENL
jgi:hypothetical protein